MRLCLIKNKYGPTPMTGIDIGSTLLRQLAAPIFVQVAGIIITTQFDPLEITYNGAAVANPLAAISKLGQFRSLHIVSVHLTV